MNGSSRRLALLALVAASSLLTSCGSLSAKLPKLDLKVAARDACPMEATAAIPPAPRVPDGAGFPVGETAEEERATGIYLGWLTLAGKDRKDLAGRLTAVRAWCEKRAAK